MENHHVEWENPLFLWPFSIAFCLPEGNSITVAFLLRVSFPVGDPPSHHGFSKAYSNCLLLDDDWNPHLRKKTFFLAFSEALPSDKLT